MDNITKIAKSLSKSFILGINKGYLISILDNKLDKFIIPKTEVDKIVEKDYLNHMNTAKLLYDTLKRE